MAPKSKKKKKATKKKGKAAEESEDLQDEADTDTEVEVEVEVEVEDEESDGAEESESDDSEDGEEEESGSESSDGEEKPKVRKPGAPKEVIAFQWKVVGRSGDLNLVLFKCVERADADREYQRLLAEGYYQDLGVHPVKAPIPSNAAPVEPEPTNSSKKKVKKK